MQQIKVVLIGAGSTSFGRGTIADLLSCQELNTDAELTVVLVDIDEAALERMYRFAQLLKEYHGTTATLEATPDREQALAGADCVITAAARNLMELWKQSFYIPAAYGFRHVFAECGGPGSAFNTLRSLHLIMPMCEDMERLCPQALLINFSNPENRVCLGATKLTKIRAVGLCHGVFSTIDTVARVLGKSREDVTVTIGGLNHFHWVLGIEDADSGEDLLPAFDQRMAERDWGLEPLAQYMYDSFGLLPFPADSHIGEYVSFAYGITGPLPNWRQDRIKVEREKYGVVLTTAEKIDRVVTGQEPLTEELAAPSGELAVPIICDIEFDRHQRRPSVNVPNQGPAVSNLPEDAVVEVPATVDASGIHPLPVGPLPEAIAAMCRLQISIQNLLVEAYRQQSKKVLLQALLLDPVVDNAHQAEQMMEEMLLMQADYLPELR